MSLRSAFTYPYLSMQPFAALLKMYCLRVGALAIEVAVEYWLALNGSTQVMCFFSFSSPTTHLHLC